MKISTFLFYVGGVLLLCSNTFAYNAGTPTLSAQKTEIGFTENKGQVCDQNNQPRPDVLFSGAGNGFAFHLMQNGYCYQLTKNNGSNLSEKDNTQFTQTIYRIDLSFVGSKRPKQISAAKPKSGYSNFYFPHCANGALNVITYNEVNYQDIYDMIDLKWYDNNHHLEYDFVLHPGADPDDIAIDIKGANISLTSKGSLLLGTEMGTIEEMAPTAYQDGKQIDCKWVIKGSRICFQLGAYNKSRTLVIDPISRIWGTYYGGGGLETVYGISTDASSNVYFTGTTGSATTASLIATTGAHQTTKSGATDAFLVKFNPSGVRQWGTYYGANATSLTNGRSCSADNGGNIYMSGTTNGTTGIATIGAHQTVNAGNTDGFLAKFSSLSGVRQWCTYYGGPGSEEGYSVFVESGGNVFMTGITSSSTGISTAGAHQTSIAGGDDAYLVKFSTSGVRQWGTYYGGSSNDRSEGCYASPSGDVYISGSANSTGGIATAGAHQAVSGGSGDGFLAKFNTSGVRQWGTFYGGSGTETGYKCAVNSAGDVFLVGTTSSTASIASAGAHQTTIGGGTDAYVVKFNTNGVRQWGTYYGGSANETGYVTGSSNTGEVYVGGTTSSASGISTAGSFQTAIGGGSDAFIAQLTSSGALVYGTYYGDTGTESGWSGFVGPSGDFYLGGTTSSANGIASTAAQQTFYQGGNDGFIVKFYDCVNVSVTLNGQSNVLCNGNSTGSATVAAAGGSGFTYTWSPSGGNTATASSLSAGTYTCLVQNSCGNTNSITVTITQPSSVGINITSNNTLTCIGVNSTLTALASGGVGGFNYTWVSGPTTTAYVVNPNASSTIYTVNVTDANSCLKTQTVVINRHTTPTISASGGFVCPGGSFTINPSGANTYTYSSGGPVVTPTATSNYTVMGSSAQGCTATPVVITVTYTNNLVVNISGANTVCSGQPIILTANGASSYSWSTSANTNTISITPTVNTTYTVLGVSGTCSNIASHQLTVNPNPTVLAVTNQSILCPGQSATLTASGATNYSWNPGGSGSSIIVSPTVDVTYTVTGTDANGCSSTAVVTQSTSLCTSLNSELSSENEIMLYPNPSNGEFTIILHQEFANLKVINALGQLVFDGELHSGANVIKLNELSSGVYFVKVGSNKSIKFLKE